MPSARRFRQVNRELIILLGMFAIAAILNFLVAGNRMVLGFYTFPTLYSAYYYGRRHATLTAVASVILVAVLGYWKGGLFSSEQPLFSFDSEVFDLTVWGGILIMTGYAMGTLYERKEAYVRELREAYHGVLLLLRQFVSNDLYVQHHTYRVSVYATAIAAELRLNPDRIEDVRTAALLHDIGVLDISREFLLKAARVSKGDFDKLKERVLKGDSTEPVGGSLRRVLPIILGYHEKLAGKRLEGLLWDSIPLEARVIALAKAYDTLTSSNDPEKKPLDPLEAREQIMRGRGTEYDPEAVDGFLSAFRRGEMKVPEIPA